MKGATVTDKTALRGTTGRIYIALLLIAGLALGLTAGCGGESSQKTEMRRTIEAAGWEITGGPHFLPSRRTDPMTATVKFGGCELIMYADGKEPNKVTLLIEKIDVHFPIDQVSPAALKAEAAKYGLEGCFPPTAPTSTP
jgi:hypothetical protein